MNPVQYIILDRTLEMSVGKAAAQAAHASVLGFHNDDPTSELRRRWITEGHYAKVVLECDDLFVAERYLNDRGFYGCMVIDEGRTEFSGGLTPTALGFRIVDKDHYTTKAAFGEFSIYGTWERKQMEKVRKELKAAVVRVPVTKPNAVKRFFNRS